MFNQIIGITLTIIGVGLLVSSVINSTQLDFIQGMLFLILARQVWHDAAQE